VAGLPAPCHPILDSSLPHTALPACHPPCQFCHTASPHTYAPTPHLPSAAAAPPPPTTSACLCLPWDVETGRFGRAVSDAWKPHWRGCDETAACAGASAGMRVYRRETRNITGVDGSMSDRRKAKDDARRQTSHSPRGPFTVFIINAALRQATLGTPLYTTYAKTATSAAHSLRRTRIRRHHLTATLSFYLPLRCTARRCSCLPRTSSRCRRSMTCCATRAPRYRHLNTAPLRVAPLLRAYCTPDIERHYHIALSSVWSVSVAFFDDVPRGDRLRRCAAGGWTVTNGRDITLVHTTASRDECHSGKPVLPDTRPGCRTVPNPTRPKQPMYKPHLLRSPLCRRGALLARLCAGGLSLCLPTPLPVPATLTGAGADGPLFGIRRNLPSISPGTPRKLKR